MESIGISNIFQQKTANGYVIILDLTFFVLRVFKDGHEKTKYDLTPETPMSVIANIINKVKQLKP